MKTKRKYYDFNFKINENEKKLSCLKKYYVMYIFPLQCIILFIFLNLPFYAYTLFLSIFILLYGRKIYGIGFGWKFLIVIILVITLFVLKDKEVVQKKYEFEINEKSVLPFMRLFDKRITYNNKIFNTPL